MPKIMRAISQSHRIDNSIAFLIKPFLRFVKVAWRLRSFVKRSILILFRPIMSSRNEHANRSAAAAAQQQMLTIESVDGTTNRTNERMREREREREKHDYNG
jgi:hypothetical protein